MTAPPPNINNKVTAKAAREARLAKALRDNLRRRKEAAKAAKPTPGKS